MLCLGQQQVLAAARGERRVLAAPPPPVHPHVPRAGASAERLRHAQDRRLERVRARDALGRRQHPEPQRVAASAALDAGRQHACKPRSIASCDRTRAEAADDAARTHATCATGSCSALPWLIGMSRVLALSAARARSTTRSATTRCCLPPVFIGFDNYVDLFQDPLFWKSLGNTLFFALGSVSLGLFIVAHAGAAAQLPRSRAWPSTARSSSCPR